MWHTGKDFRSEDGLYSLIQAQHDGVPSSTRSSKTLGGREGPASLLLPTNTKGKDLFNSMIWKDPTSTSTFYRFIASLRKAIHDDVKRATATHRFIRTLRDRRKLVRCYTQNIDGLVAPSRSRFSKKAMMKPVGSSPLRSYGKMDAGCQVVQLHGDVKTLRCTLCHQLCEWDFLAHSSLLMAGESPLCQQCVLTDSIRQAQGKRGTKVGTLRPNIILYGEEHPSADAIGDITSNDLTMSPEFLLILGTSLHVHGLKTLVREFAKAVHARPGAKGKLVFINLSRPAESVWKGIFDCWACMDCDEWVAEMRKCRPDIWQVQAELSLSIKKRPTKLPKKVASRLDDENKDNIILDSVASLPSSSPQPKVVIATPKKPRQPLQEQSAIYFKIPKSPSSSRVILDSDSQSSRPTPPSSGGGPGPTGKRKTLADLYNEEFVTPSKRRELWLDTWED